LGGGVALLGVAAFDKSGELELDAVLK